MKTTEEITERLETEEAYLKGYLAKGSYLYENVGDYTRGWVDALEWAIKSDEGDKYIVKSGDGYLLEFNNITPKMTSDPVEAKRMERKDALEIMETLGSFGYGAELVKLRIGRIK